MGKHRDGQTLCPSLRRAICPVRGSLIRFARCGRNCQRHNYSASNRHGMLPAPYKISSHRRKRIDDGQLTVERASMLQVLCVKRVAAR